MNKGSDIRLVLKLIAIIDWHIAVAEQKLIEVLPRAHIVVVLRIFLQEAATTAQGHHGCQSQYIMFDIHDFTCLEIDR